MMCLCLCLGQIQRSMVFDLAPTACLSAIARNQCVVLPAIKHMQSNALWLLYLPFDSGNTNGSKADGHNA